MCGLAVGRAECVSYVYLCHVSSCPAGRGLPAACGTRSSESDKQPLAPLLSQRPSHPTDRPRARGTRGAWERLPDLLTMLAL